MTFLVFGLSEAGGGTGAECAGGATRRSRALPTFGAADSRAADVGGTLVAGADAEKTGLGATSGSRAVSAGATMAAVSTGETLAAGALGAAAGLKRR